MKTKKAYRRAVQECLVQFYGVSTRASKELVHAWWNRLKPTPAFTSEIFLHDEPIYCAARLINADYIELNSEQEVRYAEITAKIH